MVGVGILAIALASFVWTFTAAPNLSVTGYREAADWVADRAAPNTKVAFLGNKDGSFIFNIRAREDRRDIDVVRVDKLLFSIGIMPELGFNPKKSFSEAEISDLLNRLGIQYVVSVPNTWSQEGTMWKFYGVLASPQFTEIARFSVTGNTPEKSIVIYQNQNPLKNPPDAFTMSIPAIGMDLKR